MILHVYYFMPKCEYANQKKYNDVNFILESVYKNVIIYLHINCFWANMQLFIRNNLQIYSPTIIL